MNDTWKATEQDWTPEPSRLEAERRYGPARVEGFMAGAEWGRLAALEEAERAIFGVRPANLTSYYGIQDWASGRQAAHNAVHALRSSSPEGSN